MNRLDSGGSVEDMVWDHEALIEELLTSGVLRTPHIIAAFRAIDRKDFVPSELKDDAYVNAPLPIGFGQTISQPFTVAFMLELLQPQPGEKILDVGAGSGWQTALLAHVVSQSRTNADTPSPPVIASPAAAGAAGRGNLDTFTSPSWPVAGSDPATGVLLRPVMPFSERMAGKVFAIERIEELCEFGKSNVAKYNYVEKGVVEFFCQDGSLGLPEHAPFDRIIAAASARDLPPAWREQLKIGGRIVAPIENSVWLFEKAGERDWRETEYPGFAFVPLVEGE